MGQVKNCYVPDPEFIKATPALDVYQKLMKLVTTAFSPEVTTAFSTEVTPLFMYIQAKCGKMRQNAAKTGYMRLHANMCDYMQLCGFLIENLNGNYTEMVRSYMNSYETVQSSIFHRKMKSKQLQPQI